MTRRLRAALTTGSAVSLAVVGPGAAAHAAAGGSLTAGQVVAAWGALAVVATIVTIATAGAVRWTFARLCAAALAAQPLVHVVFASGDPEHTAGHAGHGAHTSGAAAHADGWMVAAHLVVSLVVAVALRWGVRWLRTLPALARALVTPRPVVSTPYRLRQHVAPAPPVFRRDLAVLAARGSRGPPR